MDGSPHSVALIGCGRWGSIVGRKAQSCGYTITRVYDSAFGAAAPILRDLDSAQLRMTIGDACTSVDAAIIATPPTSDRVLQLAQVLDAGVKRIRIEKPFAISSDDAHCMIDMANAAGAVLTIGHTSIANALVPTLAHVARRLRQKDALESVDYFRLCNRGPAHAITPIWDLSSHDLALHYAMFPDEWKHGPPTVVESAQGEHSTHFRLEDGATFTASHNYPDTTRGIVFNKQHSYNESNQSFRLGGQILVGSHFDPLKVELERWRKGYVFPAEIGARIVEVCERAQQMAADRTVQNVVG